MSDSTEGRPTFTRRRFLKASMAAGATGVAAGVGYRLLDGTARRDFDPARTNTFLASVSPGAHTSDSPNIILIVADDLGYGDLGCYGSQAIRTPNLDQMAADGARLSDAYATGPLCSPSRAGLLSGRYPIRTHITLPLYPVRSPMDIAFNLLGVYQYGVRGIPEDEALLPEILQRRGYATGMLGKWHLGDKSPHLPNDSGFEMFYGALYCNDMAPYEIYRNREVELHAPVDQNVLTQDLTQEALQFIRQHKERSFFLYYAQPFPHIPLHASEGFRGRSEAGLYGDVVEEIDWSVGEIVSTLEELGLAERTLVIFTSDNGPWWQGSAGSTRGRKSLTFEGGFRVPFIARWPGVIPAGRVSDAMTMNFDVFSTCLSAADAPSPNDRVIDGKDILPVLAGEGSSAHETLFYYKGTALHGVRHENWKYLRRHMTDNGGYASRRQGPFLFNLDIDPNESYSLIESEPEMATQLEQLLKDWEAEVRANIRGWL
jgi:arylsulfatase A